MSFSAFDTWGDVQIPTTGALPFTPIFTSAWVTPATVPIADPTLAVILDFLATFVVSDANVNTAWTPVAGAAGTSIIKRIFPHDPSEVVFSTSHLPALYLWRESSKQEYAADDWLMDISQVKGLWVYPLAQQANQRARQPVINALAKAIGVAIERGRTPSWKQPTDPDPDTVSLGSLMYLYGNFEAFWLESWRMGKLLVPAADKTETDSYPAIDFTFTLREKLDYGLGRFPTLAGATDTISQGPIVTLPSWSASTFYASGKYVVPTLPNGITNQTNGYYYVCVSAGLTAATAPIWPTGTGARVTDGTAIWQCIGPTPYVRWVASTPFAINSIIVPQVANGFYYVATNAGSSGTVSPVFPTSVGATVTDNNITWQCVAVTSVVADSGPLEKIAQLPV